MTISTLAQLNKANGGFFFSRDTMKHTGETLKSFTFQDHPDARARSPESKTTPPEIQSTTGRVIHGPGSRFNRAVTVMNA